MSHISCFDNDATDPFANIDMSVGTGKPNNRDDVLVVQGLLLIIFSRGTLTTLFDVPASVTGFGPNGIMNQTTATLILAFKAKARKRGVHLTPGPFINPVRDFTSKRKHASTLVEMNRAANIIVAASSPDSMIDVLKGLHPELPNALSVGPITVGP
ncbi:MAG: hypothetical protein JO331_04595 [Verrucomicrobia bacterium]|nr:hypothetical protein [Verrucomicrobiota bacterium]